MVYPDPLAAELHALPPDQGVTELVLYVPMDLVADLEDAGPVPHDHRLPEVGLAGPPAQVDSDEVQLLVDLLLERRYVDTALRGDRDEVVGQLGSELVREPRVDQVDLVHDRQRGDVYPVPE